MAVQRARTAILAGDAPLSGNVVHHQLEGLLCGRWVKQFLLRCTAEVARMSAVDAASAEGTVTMLRMLSRLRFTGNMTMFCLN